MGAGAGNTPTEVLAAVCDLEGIETGVDTFAVMDVAEEIVRPVLDRLPFVGRSSLPNRSSKPPPGWREMARRGARCRLEESEPRDGEQFLAVSG